MPRLAYQRCTLAGRCYNLNMPVSDQQLKLLAFPYSKYDALIADGSIRSGKTSISFVAYIDWLMREFNGQEFIAMGVTVRTAERNIIEPYTRLGYAQKRYKLDYNRGRGVLTIKQGDRTNYVQVFGAPNERSYEPILGMTAAGCFIDQVELCNRKAVETALGRCSVDGSRYFFNCNPAYPTHWFREEWILQAKQKNALYLRFTMDDNPALSETIKTRFRNQYHGVFYQRYILGEWVVAEGLVYQFDSPDEYTCSREEAQAVSMGRWYISIDYGITNPFAAILWRVTPNRAYAVKEYYFDSKKEGRRKTDAEHLQSVKELARGHVIEDIVIDPSATSFKEEIYRDGQFGVIDADNNVLEGIMVTDQMLHDGSVKISEDCANWIREMGLYRWDDKEGRDKVIKSEDHACDAGRYMCNTILKYELSGYE